MKDKKNILKAKQKLMNAPMVEKFKMSFKLVAFGFTMVTILAILNITIYASKAGVGVFSSFPRAVGMILLILCICLSFLRLQVVAKRLTNALVEPIRELQAVAQKISAGQLDVTVNYESGDEIGQLAADLQNACETIKRAVGDADYMLGEMAVGNFEVKSKDPESYVGDFSELLISMNKMNGQLSGTLQQIRNSAEQVKAGGEQLTESAHDLAEGATNQAGAVEELAATIENVTNISEDSAKNAVMASQSASDAAEDAKKSREEINELTAAMDRITATSKEIEEIIGAIEDIADQTNLLSLNASIEAARAGEAGRGFAVVADQIGKLAADSAQSAVNTRELISRCLSEVEAGSAIVDNTIEAIGSVLASMENFAGMAAGAADASKQQVDMLKQIEAGIEQINEVVQNNSAAAQETSAVSEQLSAQAIGLEEMVHKFSLKE